MAGSIAELLTNSEYKANEAALRPPYESHSNQNHGQ